MYLEKIFKLLLQVNVKNQNYLNKGLGLLMQLGLSRGLQYMRTIQILCHRGSIINCSHCDSRNRSVGMAVFVNVSGYISWGVAVHVSTVKTLVIKKANKQNALFHFCKITHLLALSCWVSLLATSSNSDFLRRANKYFKVKIQNKCMTKF